MPRKLQPRKKQWFPVNEGKAVKDYEVFISEVRLTPKNDQDVKVWPKERGGEPTVVLTDLDGFVVNVFFRPTDGSLARHAADTINLREIVDPDNPPQFALTGYYFLPSAASMAQMNEAEEAATDDQTRIAFEREGQAITDLATVVALAQGHEDVAESDVVTDEGFIDEVALHAALAELAEQAERQDYPTVVLAKISSPKKRGSSDYNQYVNLTA